MTERAARPLILATALLLCWVEPSPCAAQSPAAAPARPAINPFAREGGQSLPSSLPPAVSSDIERFVRQSGRDVPPSHAPAPASPLAGGASPSQVVRSAADRTDVQGVRTLPPALPVGSSPAVPSPLATGLKLAAAPFEPTDLRFPINLATALRLSDARPLIVAAAQAKVWVAEADLTQAKVLWLPALSVGFDYLRHDGGGPDFNKGIMTAPSTNFFYGGAGLTGIISTTDAIYQPLVARQVLNSRHWNIQSAKNDALLQTADAYFMVHQYRGIYASTLYTVEKGHELVERIVALSRDLVPGFEVDRARNVLADLEQQAVAARQQWRVHSARLTKVLRLDPRAVVEPLEHDHVQITLIDPASTLDDLMPIALTNRPELASRRALIEAATVSVRREKARPLIPMVLLNGYQTPGGMLFQAGIFGLGPNSSLNQWRGRDDVSIQLVWQLQNLGIGNLAQIKAQRGRESQAIIDLRKTQDAVVEEVNQAHARLQSAAARVVQADRSLRTGIITFNGSAEGLKQTSRFSDVLVLISRPQEAIYALQLLKTAFDEYFSTVAEYNRAQFELFHALGYPAIQVASLQTPGEVVPVDTARPSYLPPVGNGPPPATR
ncbi:MAG: TolC family protein [Isosphaeraceae bacterium]|nr:TolC family protein [Isosphaeraceae bacterium]